MARRLLSTAVLIRKPATQAAREAAILRGQTATVSMPTDDEMRDAIARLVRDLEQMRQARIAGGAEWVVEEGSFAPNVNVTAEGEIVLRGGIIIVRPD